MLGVSERGPRRETGEGDRATPPSITTARVAQLPRAQGRRAAAAPSDPTSGRTSAGKDRAAAQVGRGAAVAGRAPGMRGRRRRAALLACSLGGAVAMSTDERLQWRDSVKEMFYREQHAQPHEKTAVRHVEK